MTCLANYFVPVTPHAWHRHAYLRSCSHALLNTLQAGLVQRQVRGEVYACENASRSMSLSVCDSPALTNTSTHTNIYIYIYSRSRAIFLFNSLKRGRNYMPAVLKFIISALCCHCARICTIWTVLTVKDNYSWPAGLFVETSVFSVR